MRQRSEGDLGRNLTIVAGVFTVITILTAVLVVGVARVSRHRQRMISEYHLGSVTLATGMQLMSLETNGLVLSTLPTADGVSSVDLASGPDLTSELYVMELLFQRLARLQDEWRGEEYVVTLANLGHELDAFRATVQAASEGEAVLANLEGIRDRALQLGRLHSIEQAELVAVAPSVLFSIPVTIAVISLLLGFGWWSVHRGRRELRSIVAQQEMMEAQLRRAQRLEAVGTMAGGIAHDFNNILAPILGGAELVLEDCEPGTPVAESAEFIQQSALRAKDLVQKILMFSRMEAVNHEAFHLGPIVAESLDLIESTIPSFIEVVRDLELDCVVSGDPTQIQQVVVNLCTNSRHAIPITGGVLEVRLRSETVAAAEAGMGVGEYACLTVTDSGAGMDENTREQMFDPFFTTRGEEQGTGLGLSVSSGIVAAHGGAIVVDSEVGAGTTVRVYLPVSSEHPSVPLPEEMLPVSGTERVLFIDDEVQIVEFVRAALAREGYSVAGFVRPLEGLEAFRAEPEAYDVVITDQTMPRLSGTDLAREILTIRPDMPIILATGFSESVTPESASRLGIAEFMMKPVSGSDIAKAIRRVVTAHS